jgi:drug/metabolite transporter (DMT)-like permease
LEITGAVIGFSGAIIALQEVRDSGEVTFIGDLAAFFGAVMVVGYLMIGRRLRSEGLPLHLYAFPVTVVAAILLTFSSMLFEASPIGMAAADLSTFGWLDAAWLLPVAYLAIGPGFVGHTGINAALRWLPTLLISVTLVMEPMLGAIIGWALGVEEIPGMWTWLGGPLMVAGTVMVTVAVARKTAPPSEAE